MADNGNDVAVEDRGAAHLRAAGGAGTPQGVLPQGILPPGAPRQARLGEELPVFCERCGYSLHGLPQTRCDTCRVLYFNCPECGHHQPINTLRPAVQRALGRLRALGLAGIVFLKINFFFWCLFAWAGGAMAIAYSYNRSGRAIGVSPSYRYGPTDFEAIGGVILFLFGLGFAMIGRMLLLRWRSGALVGLSLGGLIAVAMLIGAHLRQWEYRGGDVLPSPIAEGFILYMFCAALGALIGSQVVWGIWVALAHAFLPQRAAIALIEWQRALSSRDKRGGQTDAATSVTA